MTELIQLTILVILIGSFLLEKWLEYLNMSHTVTDLPPELDSIYDEKEYRRSQLYKKENTRFSFLSSTVSLIIMVALVATGFFGLLDSFLQEHTQSYYILVLLFFGVLGFASDLLSVPFEIYDTFKIEEKYGFNKTTPSTFVKDKLKG